MIYVLRQWKGGNIHGICAHLARHCVAFRVVEAWTATPLPPLRRGDAVLVLGGPPSVCRFLEDDYEVDFLRREAVYLEEARRLEVAVLGICLGHQLLGAMRARRVTSGSLVFGLEEVGVTEHGRGHWLYQGVPRRFRVYQHHRDSVRTVASDETVLADSESCAIESVAWGDKIVSTQFHPEVLAHEMPDVLERYADYLHARGVTVDAEMQKLPSDYETSTQRMFDNFLHRAGCIERPAWIARTWYLSQAVSTPSRPAA